MPLIERYLLRQFVQNSLAALAVILLASFSAIVADLLSEIARGRLPVALLLSQLGLRIVQYLPLLLPLAMFLGLLLAIGRLYRQSEMTVLAGVGFGPRQVLRPVARLALPVVGVLAGLTLWVAPAAQRQAELMIEAANRSLLVAGMEAGRFTTVPGREGVLYVGEMAADGTRFGRLFLQTEKGDRVDVVTARTGELFFDGEQERYLRLHEGFRVEGSLEGLDFKMMRFERNDVRLPDNQRHDLLDDPGLQSTASLLGETAPIALAELHWRLSMPLAAAVLAVLAVPLARSQPRQPRYGQVLLALLSYLLYVNLLMLGTAWLAAGQVPLPLGLWWVHAVALGIALWRLARDGGLRRPRALRA